MRTLKIYPLLSRLVAASVNVSQTSARILQQIKVSGDLRIQLKGHNDYVTKADILSQLNIIRSLEKMFPKVNFYGEEGNLTDHIHTNTINNSKYYFNDGQTNTTVNQTVLSQIRSLPDCYQSIKEEDILIWVDPLDGTTEYTQGLDMAKEVTILIGISWQGKPIAGVINQPFYQITNNTFRQRVLWGIVGLGAFDLHQGQLHKPPNNGTGKTRIVTTRSRITNLMKRDLSSIPNSELMHLGGAGHKVLSLIDGIADCYLYPKCGTKRWDTCAPEAVVRSLNGKMTDVFGNEYSYKLDPDNPNELIENCFGVVFSLDERHDRYLKCISEQLKSDVLQNANKIKQEKFSQMKLVSEGIYKN